MRGGEEEKGEGHKSKSYNTETSGTKVLNLTQQKITPKNKSVPTLISIKQGAFI